MLLNYGPWLCVTLILGFALGDDIGHKQRLCGSQLLGVLNSLCKGCFYNSQAVMLEKRVPDMARPRIVDDCCLRSGGCSYNYLMSYCCPPKELESLSAAATNE